MAEFTYNNNWDIFVCLKPYCTSDLFKMLCINLFNYLLITKWLWPSIIRMLSTDIASLHQQNARQRVEIFSLKKETFRYVCMLPVTIIVIKKTKANFQLMAWNCGERFREVCLAPVLSTYLFACMSGQKDLISEFNHYCFSCIQIFSYLSKINY